VLVLSLLLIVSITAAVFYIILIRRRLARDIAERKRVEEESRRTVSLLQSTLESTTDGILVVDRIELEQLVILRQELELLHSLAPRLTPEQRLVLACQVSLQMDCGEFCRLHGWSSEKYRKVAQRARGRLRLLVNQAEDGVPVSPRASDQHAGTDL